jgi:NAD(P)-dependent dehydrogenase (short-subunit alcohol dehydrogenase family)
MGQVQGKVALVTGGASGIGAACSATLAREGAKVVVTDIDDALGKQTVSKIQDAGGEAVYLHQDVTDETRWKEIVSETEKRYGGLNILVSNAGIGVGAASIVDMTLADWRRQTAINLDGVFLSVKYSLPVMRRSGGGSIVMMSSIAGLRGSPILAGYCATKGGVRLFAKSIAMECAQAGDNIRVNSVHPGIIDTPIWGKIPNGGGQLGHNSPMRADELAKVGAPLGRAGQAQEIADGVLFLASDASRYITGTELIIDGGITAGGVRRAPEAQR